jgi:tetratricopeptide (TPR) repeat protein
MAYTSTGALAKAQNSYQAALRLDPDNWDAIFEMGKTCISLGMKEDARKYLEDILKRNPNYRNKSEVERLLSGL